MSRHIQERVARKEDTEHPRNGDEENVSWNPNAFGAGSAPHLIDSFKEFITRYGSTTRTQSRGSLRASSAQSGSIYQACPPVPLLSDFISSQIIFPVDLRRHLPDRATCQTVIEVFRRTVQTYNVPFYWPFLEAKLDKAWNEPIMEDDSEAVRGVFCVVVMMIAVGSQLVLKEELMDQLDSVFIGATQERWGFVLYPGSGSLS